MNSMKRIMKSEKEIKAIVKEEVEKAYPEISRDVAYQTFAMVFLILNRDYGFGKKRLQDLKDSIEMEYWKMQERPCGIDYNSDDVTQMVKDKFGIDFNVSQLRSESMKYIDTAKAADKIKEAFNISLCDLVDVFAEIPAEDVQPVKHGHWEEVTEYGGWDDTYYRCSVCGEEWYIDTGTPIENGMKYCQSCGARMDGDANE